MASLQERKRKNGKSAYLIQFVLKGRRRSVFIRARCPKRIAKEVCLYIDELATAVEFGTTPERRVLNWLDSIDDDLRRRLYRAGLLDESDVLLLVDLIERYFEAESFKLRPKSVKHKRVDLKRASLSLDFSIEANKLTTAEIARFKSELSKTLASASCAGILKTLARVYSWGKTVGLVEENPFEKIEKGSIVNKKREHYVTLETYDRVLSSCVNQELRAVLAFYRIGGLRRGEVFEERWEDVDWANKRLKVRSPKTEHLGKDHRVIPLFPRLLVELKQLHRQTGRPRKGLIVTRYSPETINNAIKSAVLRSGTPVWERLIQNLRSSRANEIYREFGEVAESMWVGHSARVAQAHYLHLLDSDYDKASCWKEE